LLDQSRSEKQRATFDRNALICPLVKFSAYFNALGVAIDWIGIGLAIAYAVVDEQSQITYLTASTVASGMHNAWCAINFNMLKHTALMTSTNPASLIKKKEASSKAKIKKSQTPQVAHHHSPTNIDKASPASISEMDTRKI
jgi:hypothetical protein